MRERGRESWAPLRMIWSGPSKSTRSGGGLAVSMLAPTFAPTQAAYGSCAGKPASDIAGLLAQGSTAARRSRGEGHECNQHLCPSHGRPVRFRRARHGRRPPGTWATIWNNDRARCFVRPVPRLSGATTHAAGRPAIWPAVGPWKGRPRMNAFRRCPTSRCGYTAQEQSRKSSCQRPEQAWTAHGGHRLPPDARIDGPDLSVVRLPEMVRV